MSITLQLACFNCGKTLTDGIFCDKNCREEYGRKQLEMQNRDEHDARWRETHPKAPRPVSLNPLLLPPRRCPCGIEFQPKRKDQTACNRTHYVRYWYVERRAKKRRMNPKLCVRCGNVLGLYGQKYCSKKCKGKAFRENRRNDPAAYAKLKASWRKPWWTKRGPAGFDRWLERFELASHALEKRLLTLASPTLKRANVMITGAD